MSEISDTIRAFIAAQTLEVGRGVVLRQIRLVARKVLRLYADEHYIIDFQDTALVTQRHRDKRTSVIASAQTRSVAANTASDVTALLVVFDDIAPLID